MYLDASDQASSAANLCRTYAAKADKLAAQGMSSAKTNSMSEACQQASTSSFAQNPSKGLKSLDASSGQAKLDSEATTGSAAWSKPASTGKISIDARTAFEGESPGASKHALATVKPVPNHSGGGSGLPGATTQATLGSSRVKPASKGYLTDILQGTTAGGGYNYNNSRVKEKDDSGFFGGLFGSRSKAKGDESGLLGMDLRNYLPGGANARRSLAGFNERSEINAKEEDIWRRVSEKFVEKCKLGVLWKCE